VVETVKKSLAETEKSGKSFKAQFRLAHAERLRKEHGLTVKAATFDTPVAGEDSALSYRDPTGKALAPKLPPPPIDGPDVGFTPKEKAAFEAKQDKARKAAGAQCVVDVRGRRWALNNQGRVHMLMAGHSMKKIETVYGSIFEGILGERVSTKPVVVTNPFPWVRKLNVNEPTLQLQGALR